MDHNNDNYLLGRKSEKGTKNEKTIKKKVC